MCLAFALFVLAVIIVTLSVRMAWQAPGDMGAALPTIFGIGLTLSGFLGPWVKFSPVAYLVKIGPGLLAEYVPEAFAFVLRLVGQRFLAILFSLAESVGAVPGWLLPILSHAGWGARLVPLLVGLIGVVSLLWFPLARFCSPGTRYVAGLIQACTSLLAACLLLLVMPAIDTWMGREHLWLGALAVFSGARMGLGVWLAWLGLTLLSIGGVVEAISVAGLPSAQSAVP